MKLLRKDIENLPPKYQPFAYHFNINKNIEQYVELGLIDRNKFEFVMEMIKYSTIITKGESFIFKNGNIIVTNPLGVYLKIPCGLFGAVNMNNIQQIYNIINNVVKGFFKCDVVRKEINLKFGKKYEYEVVRIAPLAKKVDVNEAQQLINDKNYVKALLDILGYKYDERIAYLSIIRMFPIVANCHICQLTLPNTGKTYFSLRVSDTFDFYYSTTSITEAKLVFNAVNNMYGVVFTKDGIIIDEILTVRDLKSMEELLLSGLENGIWTKSSGRVISLPVRKIPFIFFGNIPSKTLHNSNNRKLFGDLLRSELRLRNVNAFLDRLALVDIFEQPVSSNTLIKEYCYSNSTFAGWVEIVRTEYQKKLKDTEIKIQDIPPEINIEGYSLSTGRMIRYAKMLKAYLSVILPPELIPSDMDLFNAVCGDSLYNMLNLKPVLEDDSNNSDNQNDSNDNSGKYKYLLDTEKQILSVIDDYGGKIDIDVIVNETGLTKGTVYNTLYSLENKGLIRLEGKTVRLIQ